MKLEYHDLHGTGDELCEVYECQPNLKDPWSAVTNIQCPVINCKQTIVWYEAGYSPGYRVCMDRCNDSFCHDSLRHRFIAGHDLTQPVLIKENENA